MNTHPWKITETHFDPNRVKAAESLFSIGNGMMGQRANFEETYSGESLRGSYIGGIYYPDKTRVGWWKNGYPEYYAKVLNSAFWIGVEVKINGELLDLHTAKVLDFYRELDMRHGLLTRRFTAELSNGVQVEVEAIRFVSMVRTELGAMRYSVKVLNSNAKVELTPRIDANVKNEDANYGETFWDFVAEFTTPLSHCVTMRTQKTAFEVCWFSQHEVVESPKEHSATLFKYVGITSSLNHRPQDLALAAQKVATDAQKLGFDALRSEHGKAWEEKWAHCDVEIGGDDKAQQGIRFCIFHLLQTYTGKDSRLNVGPKGFTGEKYGGSTYWDT